MSECVRPKLIRYIITCLSQYTVIVRFNGIFKVIMHKFISTTITIVSIESISQQAIHQIQYNLTVPKHSFVYCYVHCMAQSHAFHGYVVFWNGRNGWKLDVKWWIRIVALFQWSWSADNYATYMGHKHMCMTLQPLMECLINIGDGGMTSTPMVNANK